jgi:DNA-binding CsgD family transcriptional regulator
VTLTGHEQRIIRLLLAGGGRNADIAAAAGCNEHAVSATLARIYERTGYHTRLALALAVERGELTITDPGETS